jgi:hypothetical protein
MKSIDARNSAVAILMVRYASRMLQFEDSPKTEAYPELEFSFLTNKQQHEA